MFRRGSLILYLLPLLLVASCGDDNVTGSGRYIDIDYPMRDISRVAAYDAFEVDITVEDSTAVRVRMDDNIIGHIDVQQDTNTVRFRLDEKGRNLRSVFYHAYVTVPFLRGVTLSDGSKGSIVQTGTINKDFECSLDKGSELVGTLRMEYFTLDAQGGSTLRMGGEASGANLTLDKKSFCDLTDFSILECNILADNESTVYVNVTQSLSVNIRGGAKVYYHGPEGLTINAHVEPGCVFEPF